MSVRRSLSDFIDPGVYFPNVPPGWDPFHPPAGAPADWGQVLIVVDPAAQPKATDWSQYLPYLLIGGAALFALMIFGKKK